MTNIAIFIDNINEIIKRLIDSFLLLLFFLFLLSLLGLFIIWGIRAFALLTDKKNLTDRCDRFFMFIFNIIGERRD